MNRALILKELNEIKLSFGLTSQTDNLRLSFEEILESDKIDTIFKTLFNRGFLQKIFWEFIPCINIDQKTEHHSYPVDLHILKAVNNVKLLEGLTNNEQSILRWTLLLHDIGKPFALNKAQKKGRYYFTGHAKIGANMTPKILRRFGLKLKEIKQIKTLVAYHEIFRYMRLYNMGKWGNRLTPENIFAIITKVGIKNFDLLLKVHKCDYLAQSEYWRDKKEHLNTRTEDIFNYYKKVNNK